MPIAPFLIEEGTAYSGLARILSVRTHGGVTFMRARFRESTAQLMLLRGKTEAYEEVKNLPLGTIVQVQGTGCRTRRGEPAIELARITIVCSCQRPLPDKFHGISDERRYRDRATMRIVDDSVFAFELAMADMTAQIRLHLLENGFREFNTGTLQAFFEGGLARPFLTLCHANGKDYALSLTSELKLKRLIIAGCQRVCDISSSFRNEGMDSVHSPEFTLLEAYAVQASVDDMMTIVEGMVRRAVRVLCTHFVCDEGSGVSAEPFEHAFSSLAFRDAYALHVDPEGFDHASLQRLCTLYPNQFTPDMPRFTWVMKTIEKFIAPTLVHPTFLTHVPSGLSPLVRQDPIDPSTSRRAFFFAGGSFIADLYEDESDPTQIEQAMRDQARENGKEPNREYLDLLAFGIPPTAGIGMGLNRLFMAFLPVAGLPLHIKETTPFPL